MPFITKQYRYVLLISIEMNDYWNKKPEKENDKK